MSLAIEPMPRINMELSTKKTRKKLQRKIDADKLILIPHGSNELIEFTQSRS